MHIKNKGERQKIIKDLQQCITSDDVIATMISFLGGEQFPLDSRKIHSAVHEIKTKFPELLAEFSFTRNDVYPFSRLLERVLFRLINSGLVYYIGPDMKVGIISNKSKQHIKKNILPLFGREDQEKLAQMGRLFEQLILQQPN